MNLVMNQRVQQVLPSLHARLRRLWWGFRVCGLWRTLGWTRHQRRRATPTLEEARRVSPNTLEQRTDYLLRELLSPQNRPVLEQYRFHGSTNRVYRIPLSPEWDQFIVVKLLPSPWVEIRNRSKKFLRNLLYREHDVSVGRKRVQLEIERAREWQREGLPVPPLVETSLPGVRIFLGLPYPTLYTILSDQTLDPKRKLQILQAVVKALSVQHQLALEKDKKSLVHRDPGPWNIMFDREKGRTYWFDLEHPAEYPKMDLEALMVRALRVFLYGVLDHLGDHFNEVIKTVVDNYEHKQALWKFVDLMEQCRSSPLRHLMQLAGWRRSFRSRQLIDKKVRYYLETIASPG